MLPINLDSSPVSSKSHPGQITTVSHFSSFHINTPLSFVLFFFTKWPPETILDGQKSLLITILDQYANFYFLNFF